MAPRSPRHNDNTEAESFRYRYVGDTPAVIPAITGHGIGVLDPGDEFTVPVVLDSVLLEPVDKATRDAVSVLVDPPAAPTDAEPAAESSSDVPEAAPADETAPST